ncbi:MAG TPA: phage Gp37/Gp68 family protein [Beijerinckia sp.]|jgi:protein gp37|nr:phage Gp37/Gp68 family protein [Beijerinckia sp.]
MAQGNTDGSRDAIRIEYAEATWDPIAGCTRKSAACRHCYAEALTAEASQPGMWGEGFADKGAGGASWTGKVEIQEDRLKLPLEWEKPSRIFVNSISDLFHESLASEVIDRVFAVMALAPQHIFQVLTKRPKVMQAYMADKAARARIESAMEALAGSPVKIAGWPLPNVWLGVTAENQKEADRRIPLLLQTPAALRWAAAEPLLEKVDFKVGTWLKADGAGPRLDWIVAGGETGAEGQKCHPDWARALRDQCAQGATPFFWTQWGEHIPSSGVAAPSDATAPVTFTRIGSGPASRELDGILHDAYPPKAGA